MRKCVCWVFVAICAICPAMGSFVLGADRVASTQPNSTSKAPAEPVEIREFEVRVDNKAVGTHRLAVRSDGTKQTVGLQTDIKLDFIVYAYVFKFRATETWRDGRVDTTDARTDDNGKKRSFSLKTNGDIQQMSFNGKAIAGSTPSSMTTAYWRLPPADVRSRRLPIVDVDTGKIHVATLNEVGADTVTCDGRSLKCRHFKIDGASPAELWFDEKDLLVRQTSVEQGHPTELRLKQIRLTKDER